LLARAGSLVATLRGARSRTADERSAHVVELVEATAAELRAGRTPSAALAEAAAVGSPDLRLLAGVGHGGEVVPVLLRSLSGLPGAHGLYAVASCWQVAERSGVGLARGLEQVAVGLRDERAVAREVAGQLAGPRATARLLAVLPAFGWLLGAALGAAPVEMLLTTAYGWGCLLVGVPLQVAGWWWIERAAAALDPARAGGGR
jgi:tight adherence protein B